MYKAEDFIQDMNRESPKQFRLGTITRYVVNERPYVKIDGELDGKNVGIPYLNTYNPTEGDRVLMADYNGYIILGKII